MRAHSASGVAATFLLAIFACGTSQNSRAQSAIISRDDGGQYDVDGSAIGAGDPGTSGDPSTTSNPGNPGSPHNPNMMGADSGSSASSSGGTDAGTSRDAGVARRDAGPTPSSGCGQPLAQSGDFHLTTTDGDGTSRDYEVIVPKSRGTSTPLALAFVYHGAGATESTAEGFGLQNAAGAANAAIFVFPQGIAYQGYGVGWDDACGGRDMVFFDNMLAYLKSHYCIDDSRVFAAGFSWGCDHVTALACCRSRSIRAVGAASCTDEFADPSNYKTYNDFPCPNPEALGIRFTHDSNGDGAYSLQQFQSTSAVFRSYNGCSSTSSPTSVSACASYSGCAQPYLECQYPGLGHNLPGDWATQTWSFFSSFN
jgi:poly(3-hydroxybutyrate) depolymerase